MAPELNHMVHSCRLCRGYFGFVRNKVRAEFEFLL